jgi:uncharacterized protein (DUF1697 family)
VARLVVLLRGINLGATRRVAMADLRALLEGMGYEDVRTQGQSGNVALSAAEEPDAVRRAIERRLEEELGFAVDVVVRTADELAATLEADPLRDVATDGKRHMVLFFSSPPDPAPLAERSFAPEAYAVAGADVHAWCPDGVRNSPLLAALGAPGVAGDATVTARNWNTLLKLRALAEDAG